MIIFVAFVIAALAIGIWVVLRSGEREIALDKKDRELPTPSEEFQMLPTLKSHPLTNLEESWTLDSVEDTAEDHEGE